MLPTMTLNMSGDARPPSCFIRAKTSDGRLSTDLIVSIAAFGIPSVSRRSHAGSVPSAPAPAGSAAPDCRLCTTCGFASAQYGRPSM